MNKKNELTIGKTIGITILIVVIPFFFGMIGSFVYGIIYVFATGNMDPVLLQSALESSSGLFVFLTVISTLVLLGLAVLLGKKYKTNPLNDLSITNINIPLTACVIVVTLLFVVVASELENLGAEITGRFAFFSDTIVRISRMPSVTGLITALITICVLPAFIEEFLFRGVIQKNLSKKYGAKTALIISSICFAVVHLNPTVIVPIFLLSLMLGYVYIKTNNLIYSILIHFVNNVIAVLIVRFDVFKIKGLNTIGEKIEHVDLILLIPSIILLAVTIFFVYKIDVKNETLPVPEDTTAG